MDPKSIIVDYTDEQIEEITRKIKQEIQEREQMKIEQLDEATIIEESKLKILQQDQQPKQISIFLIAKTSIDSDIQKTLTEEEKYDWLMNLCVIHLEWENIYRIEKLDLFAKIQVLYLQHNYISKIENLTALENLEYLALDYNKITTIENLSHLKSLVFLKLNNNLIEKFDVQEIPKNVQYINISQNPLIKKDYKKTLVENLQYLEVIDDVELTTEEKFRILGIFPSKYENYTKQLKEFKSKSQKTKKEQSYLDKMKEVTEKKQSDLLSLKKKFKQLDVQNGEEEVYQEMNLTTKGMILKQKQKTIERVEKIKNQDNLCKLQMRICEGAKLQRKVQLAEFNKILKQYNFLPLLLVKSSNSLFHFLDQFLFHFDCNYEQYYFNKPNNSQTLTHLRKDELEKNLAKYNDNKFHLLMIFAISDSIQEMSDYAKMHAKRIDILHKSDPKQQGSLQNSLLLENYLVNREQELRNNEYELEKIKMKKLFISEPSNQSELKQIKEKPKQEQNQMEQEEEGDEEEGSYYEGSEEEEEEEVNQQGQIKSQKK